MEYSGGGLANDPPTTRARTEWVKAPAITGSAGDWHASTLVGCQDKCAATPGCVGVSYLGGAAADVENCLPTYDYFDGVGDDTTPSDSCCTAAPRCPGSARAAPTPR